MRVQRKFAEGTLSIDVSQPQVQKAIRFADLQPGELDSYACTTHGPIRIVCAFVGEVPAISREQAGRITAESKRLRRMLSAREVQSILRTDEAEDGHR